jgi:hypothetical protein
MSGLRREPDLDRARYYFGKVPIGDISNDSGKTDLARLGRLKKRTCEISCLTALLSFQLLRRSQQRITNLRPIVIHAL